MQEDSNAKLIENILENAAEQLGDITPMVMARFYSSFPEAKQSFEHHGSDNPEKLEGLMVENSLYCLMQWCEHQYDVVILLNNSVPHHNDTLNVPPSWYTGFIQATADVVADTIAETKQAEREVWRETAQKLNLTIEEASRNR